MRSIAPGPIRASISATTSAWRPLGAPFLSRLQSRGRPAPLQACVAYRLADFNKLADQQSKAMVLINLAPGLFDRSRGDDLGDGLARHPTRQRPAGPVPSGIARRAMAGGLTAPPVTFDERAGAHITQLNQPFLQFRATFLELLRSFAWHRRWSPHSLTAIYAVRLAHHRRNRQPSVTLVSCALTADAVFTCN